MKISKIRDEIILWMEVLPKAVKAVVKTLALVLIFFILRNITQPILAYYLPTNLGDTDRENIGGTYFVFLLIMTVVVFSFFNRIFKRKK